MASDRLTRQRLRRLIKAGLVDSKAYSREKDGITLTRSSRNRVNKLWDRVAEIIGNPNERPFKIYKPRNRANMRRAEEIAGLNLSGLKGVKGVPIPIPRGVSGARLRFNKQGFKLNFDEGPILDLGFQAFDRRKLIRNPLAYGAELDESIDPDAAIQVRTGAGIVSPLEHSETLGQTLERLTSRYGNWREWLKGVEVITPLNGHGRRTKKRPRKKQRGRKKHRR